MHQSASIDVESKLIWSDASWLLSTLICLLDPRKNRIQPPWNVGWPSKIAFKAIIDLKLAIDGQNIYGK